MSNIVVEGCAASEIEPDVADKIDTIFKKEGYVSSVVLERERGDRYFITHQEDNVLTGVLLYHRNLISGVSEVTFAYAKSNSDKIFLLMLKTFDAVEDVFKQAMLYPVKAAWEIEILRQRQQTT